ncbi:hypothetical protein LZ30DRAFT_63735 [Colletotrichum cereale]|nr:hypothetical protein LZ30DRAFT_63735 [Colletotrichum cereale]
MSNGKTPGCDPKMPLEAMLDGVTDKSSATPNITDFRITAPFEGNLVIKAAGAVGYGSPYRPQMVAIKVFDQLTGDPAVWANATVKAGYEQQGLVSWIGWNTGGHTSVGSAEKEDISMEATTNGGTLVVDYVSLTPCRNAEGQHLLTLAKFSAGAQTTLHLPLSESNGSCAGLVKCVQP